MRLFFKSAVVVIVLMTAGKSFAQNTLFSNKKNSWDSLAYLQNNPLNLNVTTVLALKQKGFSVSEYNWENPQINMYLKKAAYQETTGFIPKLLLAGGAMTAMSTTLMPSNDQGYNQAYAKSGAVALCSGMTLLIIKGIIAKRNVMKAEKLRRALAY